MAVRHRGDLAELTVVRPFDHLRRLARGEDLRPGLHVSTHLESPVDVRRHFDSMLQDLHVAPPFPVCSDHCHHPAPRRIGAGQLDGEATNLEPDVAANAVEVGETLELAVLALAAE